jgi:predicted negative regulator of RcsB-dependent stress response
MKKIVIPIIAVILLNFYKYAGYGYWQRSGH